MMSTLKLITDSKPIFNIKLLAEKSVVLIESEGFESEIFIPSIVKGRISFLNVINNRRCCDFVNPITKNNDLSDSISISKSVMGHANKNQTKTLNKLPHIAGGQKEKKKMEDISQSSSLLTNTNKSNKFEFNSKVNLQNQSLSYIKEQAKIAEKFQNAVAMRRQALLLAFKKDNDISNLNKMHLLNLINTDSKHCPCKDKSSEVPTASELPVDLKSNNKEPKSRKRVKQNFSQHKGVPKSIKKRTNSYHSNKVSSGHYLKSSQNSNIIIKGKGGEKKVLRDAKRIKKRLYSALSEQPNIILAKFFKTNKTPLI